MAYSVCAILILASLTAVCFFCLRKNTAKKMCKTTRELYNNFFTYKEKYTFSRLNKSNVHEELCILLAQKNNILFSEKKLLLSKNFLVTLAKVIDFKINSNKLTYRTKNKMVLIDQISSVVAYEVLYSNKCNLFAVYKKLLNQYLLKQKEQKIFKILLGQKLLILVCELLTEQMEIKKIILKSKKINKLATYKKAILNSAQIYSVKAFNPNSSKILANFNQNIPKIALNFYNELLNSELKSKIILAYLTNMFS